MLSHCFHSVVNNQSYGKFACHVHTRLRSVVPHKRQVQWVGVCVSV